MQIKPGDAVLHRGTRLLHYSEPVATCRAGCLAEVLPCLREIEGYVSQGYEAIGFVAYEAAPVFDSALVCHASSNVPLLWFGIYIGYREVDVGDVRRTISRIGAWTAAVDSATYYRQLARVREWIAAGDTYQVNYTFPMQASFDGEALPWFVDLSERQNSSYSALLCLGDVTIVSVSPELFFRLDGNRIVTRPMKGTWQRGKSAAEDDACAAALAASAKDRAENVMIVDLLRNDLGRIADTGSVRVEQLFEIERYPTVWQMTSTISARTVAGVPEIFRALFPSGSVTGAPKVRTMQIIREIEPEPRGVYCGAIGHWTAPDQAQFAVAIRTAVIDHRQGIVRYAVGSGVTWDSDATVEYAECLLKGQVLHERPEAFDLLETLRWDGEFRLLREHLGRLAASARYFGFNVDMQEVEAILRQKVADLPHSPHRIRLLVSRDGQARVEPYPLEKPRALSVCLALKPVDRDSIFLYHKTTRRGVYGAARAACPLSDEVILWNEDGEITEGTTANIVVLIDGVWYTPPVTCGLLPGTLRGKLLEEGVIHERVLRPRDLTCAQDIQFINSVRGWMPVRWMDAEPHPCEMPLSAKNGSGN